MRPLVLFGVVGFLCMAISGCTHYKPEFNQTYLPNTVPGAPQKRIDLPQYVTDRASVKRTASFFTSTTYLPVSLHWLEEDNLLFNIISEDKKSVLYSYLIIPSASEIKLLEGAEKYALLGEIEKNASLVSSESLGKRAFKGFVTALAVAAYVAAAVAGGGGGGSIGSGSGFSDDYQGKIENNGTVLDFDIKIRSERGWAFSSTSSYSLKYVAKNERTGNAVRGKTLLNISNDVHQANKDIVQDEARKWLQAWRVSPDGRYYVIGASATFVEAEDGYEEELISNYDRIYDGFDINPRWDKIALLNSKEDERTGQMDYWIEFYPFAIPLKKEPDLDSSDSHGGRRRGCIGCCWPHLVRDRTD